MSATALRFGNQIGLVALALCAAVASGQVVDGTGDGRRFYADDPLWADPDTTHVIKVADVELREDADFLINSFTHPGGDAGLASNVNTLGEVPDSSWFTNRIGLGKMNLEEIVRGPNTVTGPAPGIWTVTGRPAGGITPKFTVRDARGDTYIFKLDPAHLPELPSSVEVISTKIFHALGYNVPQDFICYVDRSSLRVDPKAEWTDGRGRKRPITDNDVDHWLRKLGRAGSEGTVRVLASRYIEGRPIGQYRYHGTRSDDPNDLYPHEKRRELRGLRVFAAWLHHDDSRSLNTFDTYVEENGRRFIKHYLLDFGSNMGSGSTTVQEPRAGYEYYAEGDKLLKGIFSFGLWTRDWMHVEYPSYPAVGNYEADFFEPWKWKPGYPNPAFDRMDEADAFWAANLLTYFTDDVIRAIVATGQISDPEAAEYLAKTLIERRDKCIRYWIRQTNPLDRFAISADGNEVTFDNAAVRTGAAPGGASYRVQWSALNNLKDQQHAVGPEVELLESKLLIPQEAWGPADDAGFRYAVARISTIQEDNPQWREPVVLTVRQRSGRYDLVGLKRPRHDAPIKYTRAAPTRVRAKKNQVWKADPETAAGCRNGRKVGKPC
jgi:hypothetical protein